MADKYDDAIEWLVNRPQLIVEQWSKAGSGGNHGGQSLFHYCDAPGSKYAAACGCLTMIRNGTGKVINVDGTVNTQLSKDIKADNRLPRLIDDIKDLRGDDLRAALQPFAEWQRRLDKEIRTTKD
jgi:hypothetical protein